MKNKYKVVALVPLEFSVEGNSDSKEAIAWVVQPRSRTMRVWETTVKRVAYFGFVMNDTECQEFLDNNT